MLGSSVIPLQAPVKWHWLFYPADDTWILAGIQESCQNPREGAPYSLSLRGTSFHAVVVLIPKIHPAHFCRESRYPTQGNRPHRFGTFLASPFSQAVTVNHYRRAICTGCAGAVLLRAVSNVHPLHYMFKDARICHWDDLALIPETMLLPSIACFLTQVCMWDTAQSCDDVPKLLDLQRTRNYLSIIQNMWLKQ